MINVRTPVLSWSTVARRPDIMGLIVMTIAMIFFV
jgi:hypothetical protein